VCSVAQGAPCVTIGIVSLYLFILKFFLTVYVCEVCTLCLQKGLKSAWYIFCVNSAEHKNMCIQECMRVWRICISVCLCLLHYYALYACVCVRGRMCACRGVCDLEWLVIVVLFVISNFLYTGIILKFAVLLCFIWEIENGGQFYERW
jgi:hypothetical protein